MTTTERRSALRQTTRPTGVESVKFRDGMIVTADDLDAAVRYPTSLLHTVLRSYFGCGVLCGLGLRVKKTPEGVPSWVLCVDRGVALDCHGHPIELCAPVELDLSPDPCSCEPQPKEVCIAVRRATSDEAPRDPCSCDVDDPRFDCRRVREHVVIEAFTSAELDAMSGVCRREPEKGSASTGAGGGAAPAKAPAPADDKGWAEALCATLTACPPCSCGECWVLLGCVTIRGEQDKNDKNDKVGIVATDLGGRRWVKPVEVLCSGLLDRVETLTGRVAEVAKLEEKVKELAGLETKVDELAKLSDRVAALEQQPPAPSPPKP